ncbi:putative intracellular protease/amidase [Pararhizobium capsulatum DSM 1112]|uniref:Intracellular protease/amidase n=1 Tax=Pararhizobium capsulatum DSM 1112 TaxID=1121113 RepID=A0ABU0BPE9_9HYPH|nr:type 1 glutamine amidotransferase family protein [Pararhizobium capsulatum]MDQ0319551.1 putative intracellular protease/amidase [Pararhizobium capsulatum DSM 1112]
MKLAIVLTEGFADWECALLMASARGDFGFEIVTATPGGRGVMSMGGLKVVPDRDAETLDPASFDALVLSGGTIWQTEAAPDLSAVYRRFNDHGRPIAAICGATLAFARAGLLDTVAHTSNSLGLLERVPQYRGADLYLDQPQAVSDQGIITASETAPVSFAAEIYRAIGFSSEDLSSYLRLFGAEHRAAK